MHLAPTYTNVNIHTLSSPLFIPSKVNPRLPINFMKENLYFLSISIAILVGIDSLLNPEYHTLSLYSEHIANIEFMLFVITPKKEGSCRHFSVLSL